MTRAQGRIGLLTGTDITIATHMKQAERTDVPPTDAFRGGKGPRCAVLRSSFHRAVHSVVESSESSDRYASESFVGLVGSEPKFIDWLQ